MCKAESIVKHVSLHFLFEQLCVHVESYVKILLIYVSRLTVEQIVAQR